MAVESSRAPGSPITYRVDDPTTEIERQLALGVRRAPGLPQSKTSAVLLDLEGNEFCLVG